MLPARTDRLQTLRGNADAQARTHKVDWGEVGARACVIEFDGMYPGNPVNGRGLSLGGNTDAVIGYDRAT
jgi:hypothetical protein